MLVITGVSEHLPGSPFLGAQISDGDSRVRAHAALSAAGGARIGAHARQDGGFVGGVRYLLREDVDFPLPFIFETTAGSAFYDSSIRVQQLASFAIPVTFLDVVRFADTLESFGFGNSFILSRESLPIDLRVRPANMVVIHKTEPVNWFHRGNICAIRPVRA